MSEQPPKLNGEVWRANLPRFGWVAVVVVDDPYPFVWNESGAWVTAIGDWGLAVLAAWGISEHARANRAEAAVLSFQRGSGCVNGDAISEALGNICAILGKQPLEGIPDAAERLIRERDEACARSSENYYSLIETGKRLAVVEHELAEARALLRASKDTV